MANKIHYLNGGTKNNSSLIPKNEKNIFSIISNQKRKKHIKNEFRRTILYLKINKKYFQKIYLFLFIYILFLFPKRIYLLGEYYIEMKFNKEGYNQVISDEFLGELPSKISVEGKDLFFTNKNKKVYINNKDEIIRLEWTNTLSNFSYMFSNLKNIIYIDIHNMFVKNCNMTFMFNNCHLLETFIYITNINDNSIEDMRGMFYNCFSLKSFNFHDLNLNNGINISYMFYNCRNLNYIGFDSNVIYTINDMKEMFYNCTSLDSINLSKIKTNSYIDFSYMFYNCRNMQKVIYNRLDIKQIKYMFYNCNSLIQINLDNFNASSDYLNMSYLFFNCSNLENVYGRFKKFNISDTRAMFFNFISLTAINFNPFNLIDYINMSKMFYNCNNISEISFDIGEGYITKCYFINTIYNIAYDNITIEGINTTTICNSTFKHFIYYPNDLSSIFYNCTSLTSLNFNYFETVYVQDISYMMYNCILLNNFYFNNTYFFNNITRNMKSAFQNCESFTSFNFPYFYTPKAEIMWDMFKGCSGFEKLDLQNFDTSQVTDMESMFEGCTNLTSLSLKSFRTNKVHYMNKMFRDCINLQLLYFNYISSQSLGTMYQMFYNCKNLSYLNIYSLTEKSQTIFEMFKGASNSFQFCVKEHQDIPNIFNEIKNMEKTTRDCSKDCYEDSNGRSSIPGSKLCCPNYEYNGACYDKCPSKTKVENDARICTFFKCPNYYNYEQNNCSDFIPDGYYLNDTVWHTIDKCDKTCKTCDQENHCLTCDNNYPFLSFGKCLQSCEYGNYSDSGILKCKCFTKECEECANEEEGLCKKCAHGYYIKSDDINYIEGLKKCYKNPPNYYLNSNMERYERCYHSCHNCYGDGNEEYHNCINCNANYTSNITKIINGKTTNNCYINCDYYHYFVEHKYYCTDLPICPSHYEFLIEELNQCVKSCKDVPGYPKIFRNKCYKECPIEKSREDTEDNSDICKLVCPYDEPFEMVLSQTCAKNCSIMDLKNKLCVINYGGNRTIMQNQDLLQSNIMNDLVSSFNVTSMSDDETILFEEGGTYYEIITTKNKKGNTNTSSLQLGECEYILKNYYGIDKEAPLYIFKIDANIEGKTGPSIVYKVYYPLIEPDKLYPLDLTICEGKGINIAIPIELDNPELYDKNSPYYNDICYNLPSDSGVDLIINDRMQEYSDNHKSPCEDSCEYMGYDETIKQIKCSCEIKVDLPLISDIKVDKDKLYKFMKIENIANFEVLKCIKLVLSKRGLKTNIGFYLFIPTIIIYFICIIYFYKKDFKSLKMLLNNMILSKTIFKNVRNKKEKKGDKKIFPKIKDKDKNQNQNQIQQSVFQEYLNSRNINLTEYISDNDYIRKNKIKNFKYNSHINNQITENNEEKENNLNIELDINNNEQATNAPPKRSRAIPKIIIHKNKENTSLERFDNSSSKKSLKQNTIALGLDNFDFQKKETEMTKDEKKQLKLLLEYNDSELNDLSYKAALRYDNRSYIEYYFSLLKINHMILKIFNKNDYNSRIIKIYLCFLNFVISYSVNALFFNDETMHKIYLDGGNFNLIYQLPQIFYAYIISLVFGKLLDFLALSEDTIIKIKSEKDIKNIVSIAHKEFTKLFFQYICFFSFSFVITIIFWYYVTCFCAVYRNTQFHLIKDTLIGFGNSLLDPFWMYLIHGIFRILAIKKKKKFLYKFSKVIQYLF